MTDSKFAVYRIKTPTGLQRPGSICVQTKVESSLFPLAAVFSPDTWYILSLWEGHASHGSKMLVATFDTRS